MARAARSGSRSTPVSGGARLYGEEVVMGMGKLGRERETDEGSTKVHFIELGGGGRGRRGGNGRRRGGRERGAADWKTESAPIHGCGAARAEWRSGAGIAVARAK